MDERQGKQTSLNYGINSYNQCLATEKQGKQVSLIYDPIPAQDTVKPSDSSVGTKLLLATISSWYAILGIQSSEKTCCY